jgi:hypothetical protein
MVTKMVGDCKIIILSMLDGWIKKMRSFGYLKIVGLVESSILIYTRLIYWNCENPAVGLVVDYFWVIKIIE